MIIIIIILQSTYKAIAGTSQRDRVQCSDEIISSEESDLDEKNSVGFYISLLLFCSIYLFINQIKHFSDQEVIRKFTTGDIVICRMERKENASRIYNSIRKLKMKSTKQRIMGHYCCTNCGCLLHAQTKTHFAILTRHYDSCCNEEKGFYMAFHSPRSI